MSRLTVNNGEQPIIGRVDNAHAQFVINLLPSHKTMTTMMMMMMLVVATRGSDQTRP